MIEVHIVFGKGGRWCLVGIPFTKDVEGTLKERVFMAEPSLFYAAGGSLQTL